MRAHAAHARATSRRERRALLRDDDRAQRRPAAPVPGAGSRARRATPAGTSRRNGRALADRPQTRVRGDRHT